MEELIRGLLSDYGWMIITALLAFLFQKTIRSFATGLMFLIGNTYNVDDIVHNSTFLTVDMCDKRFFTPPFI